MSVYKDYVIAWELRKTDNDNIREGRILISLKILIIVFKKNQWNKNDYYLWV